MYKQASHCLHSRWELCIKTVDSLFLVKCYICYTMLLGIFDSVASVTTSSRNVSSIKVPLISFVVAMIKSLLTSGLVLRNLRAPISAKVTPPMNITNTTRRFLSLAPANRSRQIATHTLCCISCTICKNASGCCTLGSTPESSLSEANQGGWWCHMSINSPEPRPAVEDCSTGSPCSSMVCSTSKAGPGMDFNASSMPASLLLPSPLRRACSTNRILKGA